MTERLEELARIAVDVGMQIHRTIGPGLHESAYETFLYGSLTQAGLEVRRQVMLPARFGAIVAVDAFRIDLLVEDQLIIEVKSVDRLLPIHGKQLLTYLRLSKRPLGLLMNFNTDLFKDGVKRVIDSRSAYRALQ